MKINVKFDYESAFPEIEKAIADIFNGKRVVRVGTQEQMEQKFKDIIGESLIQLIISKHLKIDVDISEEML